MPASYDVDPSQLGRLTCASLTVDNEGETVELNGWVNRRRDLGGLIFIDLRDRFGITQIIFNPEIVPAAHEIASIGPQRVRAQDHRYRASPRP